MFFPKNKRITDDLKQVINVFEDASENIRSDLNQLESNAVLSCVSTGLETLGYKVEKSKKDEYKIKVPVLFGESGTVIKSFEADAYHFDKNILVEVEAGRGFTNYQFLKDFFEACCMVNTDYLCIAVREIYRTSADYNKVCDFFESMYAANRFIIPLKGLLIIGY